ncbi:FxDxF family PEP-CTERM protein [Herbaspirillum robiniae]|uniref:PEP-CTERM sorting domain-containing protein n=1 Tax=Herbaspirillum robiniae TaxID=2014887 RepID=A0ABX2LQP2_9BURK|nr:FxDxF family PEP-CTERM protein [Herbaspirillum robiniae]NUU00887.1 PEP-CTERM sorting domain-containing protein [Herbaspirillum robiniae]
MQKHLSSLLLAVSLAAAGTAAHAAQINSTTPLEFEGKTSTFGSAFDTAQSGQTFQENFTFSTAGASTATSAVISIALNDASALNITGFTLSGNGSSWSGTKSVIGATQYFTLQASNIAAGDYTLAVTGTVNGTAGGSFGGNISVAAVPEASTTAMMLGGLAVVGLAAMRSRRRNQQRQDPGGANLQPA